VEVKTNKRNILVIEDEPFICRVCVKTLVADGFDVDIAGNGLVALEMASKKTYDLIFSDVRTPEVNGIQFYEYIKKKQPALADRIIFTTGDIMSPDVKLFLSKSHNLFLAKPFLPEELRAVVRKAISKFISAPVS